MDIEQLVRRLSSTTYESERFHRAIYYAKELEGASILILANWEVVFAGLKSLKMLKLGRQILLELSQLVSK